LQQVRRESAVKELAGSKVKLWIELAGELMDGDRGKEGGVNCSRVVDKGEGETVEGCAGEEEGNWRDDFLNGSP
jgi:hypothetical protein